MNVLSLLFVTVIWGMGFIATKWTLVDYSPLWSNSIRFFFAALISLPFLVYFKSYNLRDRFKLKWIFAASLCLLAGMLLQTMGLEYTTAAKSGFITCLYSLIIPLMVMSYSKKRYGFLFWLLLSQSLVGIAMLCDFQWSNFNYGDFLTLICAFAFAGHFLCVNQIANKFSSIELNSLQCFLVGVFSIPLVLAMETAPDLAPLLDFTSITTESSLLGFLLLSLFSSFIAFGILASAQKTLSPHIVGMICLLESPFAAILGFLFLSESLNTTGIVGCILVMCSVGLLPFTQKENIRAVLQWLGRSKPMVKS
ncbi:MAG: DMT family transporter [Bdellovibrionales bacterium]